MEELKNEEKDMSVREYTLKELRHEFKRKKNKVFAMGFAVGLVVGVLITLFLTSLQ